MRAIIVSLILTMLLAVGSAFAQTASPPPSNGPNPGPAESFSGATSYEPGDPHGAVGLAYVVLKANEEFQFINRATGAVTTTSDSAFWGTNWGFATLKFRGDGRVYFDPYGPGSACSTGGGRWLALELAQANYSNGTHQGGIVWAISQTPDPTGSWAFWWTADPNAQSSTLCTAGNLCRSDYPQLGFNTSFVAVSVHQFYKNLDPEIFVFPKAPAECSGSIPVWLNVEDAPNDVTCPAQTYFTNGQDVDGSTLYLINKQTPSSATLRLDTITSAATGSNSTCGGTTPNICYNPLVSSPSGGSANGWSIPLNPFTVPQGGTSVPIGDEAFMDRFSSCAVRNSAMWAAHTVPLTSPAPPAPFYVGRSDAEQEQAGSYPATLTVTVSTPAGVHAGDLLAVVLSTYGSWSALSPTVPAGWSLLTFTGRNSKSIFDRISGIGCINDSPTDQETHWLATGVYPGSTTGSASYSFSLGPLDVVSDCSGSHLPELVAHMIAYRGAGSSVTAYGYPSADGSDPSSVTTGNVTVPANRKLVNIFYGAGFEADEEPPQTNSITYNTPVSGNPQLTTQGTSSPVFPYLDADAWIGSSGASAGPYTVSWCCLSGASAGFQLLLQPMPSWVARWWDVGVDSQLGAAPAFFSIGGAGIVNDGLDANTIDPSIAVNNSGDVLIGFSSIPVHGYYSSAYVLKSHNSASQDTPYVYQPGGGRYTLSGTGETRTGDYSHTSVDPNDDNTLWTNVGYAGSHLTTSTGYSFWGWKTSWALVTP